MIWFSFVFLSFGAKIATDAKSVVDSSKFSSKLIESVADDASLKLVQIMFRHGARTPLLQLPVDPNENYDYGVEGLGQLTETGIEQAISLGKLIRTRYGQFISKKYLRDEIFVQSSDIDRTILTAQYTLAGIYENIDGDSNCIKNSGFVPVHVISASIDNKILFSESCPKFDRLEEEYVKSESAMKFEAEFEPLYDYLTEKSGLNITNFIEASSLTDTLFIEDQNRLELPDWADDVFPEKLMPSYRLFFEYETADPALKRLRISPLVSELVKNIDININPQLYPQLPDSTENQKAKLYMYSGHDTTIASFLNAFGVFDRDPPMYTSAVILELHQLDQDTSQRNDTNYFLKIFYRKFLDEPIRELFLPNCPVPCSLSNFKKQYGEFLMDEHQWELECSS